MFKIDTTDKKILFELDKDARRSTEQIAKQLKLKRETVNYRIKRLEQNKIIKGYYAIIDYSKLGYLLIRLYIKFQNTSIEIENEIINYIVQQKFTLTVYKAEGEWDLAIGFLVKKMEDFNKIHEEIQYKYKKYFYNQNISLFLQYVHYLKNYLVDKEYNNYTAYRTGENSNIDIDNKDIEILKIISKNAKTPILEISKQTELNSMTIIYRIKQLEKKKVILAYRALIDHTMLGYEYFKIDLEIDDFTKKSKLQEFAKTNPNIIYEDITIGGSDFEFDAELKNHEQLYDLITEIKIRFPTLIRTHKYIRVREILKYVYFPE